MRAKRVKPAARMLPDTAPLVPMEAQSPKHTGQTGFAGGRNIQPNPFANDTRLVHIGPGNCVRKQFKTSFRGQSTIDAMPNKRLACSFLFDDSWLAFAGAAASINILFFISFFLMIAVRVSPYAACFTHLWRQVLN